MNEVNSFSGAKILWLSAEKQSGHVKVACRTVRLSSCLINNFV